MRKLTPPTEPLSLADHLSALEHLFRDAMVAVYLYGSHGTPAQTPLSDIDLAVVAESERELDVLELTGKVAAVVGDDVSVTVLNQAPLPFRFKVLTTGQPLFVFDRASLTDFTERTLKFYHDFRPDYEAMLRDYDRGLREHYGR